jgi:hypothetical protein
MLVGHKCVPCNASQLSLDSKWNLRDLIGWAAAGEAWSFPDPEEAVHSVNFGNEVVLWKSLALFVIWEQKVLHYMLESGATFAPDLGLDPTLELDIAGESLAFESSVPWALIDTVFGMICLDRCTKVRRPCITSKVDEDVFGLGGRKTRLVVDHTPLLGRVGGPNIGYVTNHRRSNRRGPTGTDKVCVVWERLTAKGTDATVLTASLWDTAGKACSTLANVGCLVRIREVPGPLLHRSLTLDTRGRWRRGVCLAAVAGATRGWLVDVNLRRISISPWGMLAGDGLRVGPFIILGPNLSKTVSRTPTNIVYAVKRDGAWGRWGRRGRGTTTSDESWWGLTHGLGCGDPIVQVQARGHIWVPGLVSPNREVIKEVWEVNDERGRAPVGWMKGTRSC